MENAIKTYDFKPGLSTEIELVPISSIFNSHKQSVIKPHRADFYYIFWFTHGNPVHTVDFVPINIQPGTLLFVSKNRVHIFDQSGDYDGWMLLFTDAFFVQTTDHAQFLNNTVLFHDLLDFPIVDVRAGSNLVLIIEQIQQELAHHKDLLHAPLLRNMLHNLLMLADRELRSRDFSEIKKGPDFEHTIAFTQLLEKQFTYEKAINFYAAQLGITVRRLQQATAAAIGKTPKQIVEERIVLEAKRLLAHSSQSVKEIGFALGFDEPTNFIRFFRRQAKKTPSVFIQSLLV